MLAGERGEDRDRPALGAGSGRGALWARGDGTAARVSRWEDASVFKVRGGKESKKEKKHVPGRLSV